MAAESEGSICSVCKKCVKSNECGMGCEGFCQGWYHITCVQISKRDYDRFRALGEQSVWYCVRCRLDVRKMIQEATTEGDAASSGSGSGQEEGRTSPALSIVLDEINTLNSGYLALEKRIISLEQTRDRPCVGTSDISPAVVTSDIEGVPVTLTIEDEKPPIGCCQPSETKCSISQRPQNTANNRRTRKQTSRKSLSSAKSPVCPSVSSTDVASHRRGKRRRKAETGLTVLVLRKK